MAADLQGKRVAILAADGVERVELDTIVAKIASNSTQGEVTS